ncbi:unnamed protein product [Protopolystoma xenopodis]|uniref:Uncharacterized protein n=1 Tax=Protopolystoma xenopodis TaxID=117903 RepID=A0A3S5CMS4_9PLAT|nr:unnamed protein product [Protopolystoma xenopodis]
MVTLTPSSHWSELDLVRELAQSHSANKMPGSSGNGHCLFQPLASGFDVKSKLSDSIQAPRRKLGIFSHKPIPFYSFSLPTWGSVSSEAEVAAAGTPSDQHSQILMVNSSQPIFHPASNSNTSAPVCISSTSTNVSAIPKAMMTASNKPVVSNRSTGTSENEIVHLLARLVTCHRTPRNFINSNCCGTQRSRCPDSKVPSGLNCSGGFRTNSSQPSSRFETDKEPTDEEDVDGEDQGDDEVDEAHPDVCLICAESAALLALTGGPSARAWKSSYALQPSEGERQPFRTVPDANSRTGYSVGLANDAKSNFFPRAIENSSTVGLRGSSANNSELLMEITLPRVFAVSSFDLHICLAEGIQPSQLQPIFIYLLRQNVCHFGIKPVPMRVLLQALVLKAFEARTLPPHRVERLVSD